MKFDTQWREAISYLPPEQQAELTEAISLYQKNGIMPVNLAPELMMGFLIVKPIIDRRKRINARARERRRLKACACINHHIMATSTATDTMDTIQPNEMFKEWGARIDANSYFMHRLADRYLVNSNSLLSYIPAFNIHLLRSQEPPVMNFEEYRLRFERYLTAILHEETERRFRKLRLPQMPTSAYKHQEGV